MQAAAALALDSVEARLGKGLPGPEAQAEQLELLYLEGPHSQAFPESLAGVRGGWMKGWPEGRGGCGVVCRWARWGGVGRNEMAWHGTAQHSSVASYRVSMLCLWSRLPVEWQRL